MKTPAKTAENIVIELVKYQLGYELIKSSGKVLDNWQIPEAKRNIRAAELKVPTMALSKAINDLAALFAKCEVADDLTSLGETIDMIRRQEGSWYPQSQIDALVSELNYYRALPTCADAVTSSPSV